MSDPKEGSPIPSPSRAKASGKGATNGHRIDDDGTRWSRAHTEVNRVVDNFYYGFGLRVAQNPLKTLTICFCFVILCCLGFVNFDVVTRAEDLWVPTNSLSSKQQDIVLSYFDNEEAFAVFVLENPEDEGSVLTKESMDTFWELHAKILDIETSGGYNHEDLCSKEEDGVTCTQPRDGVGRFWGNSRETYLETISSDADVLEDINVPWFPDGAPVSIATVFGNSAIFDVNGNVTGAKVMVQSYELALDIHSGADSDALLEWEEKMQDLMANEAEELDYLNLVYFTSRSIDDAIEESVSGDVHLLIIIYAVMVVVVMVYMGRCRMGAAERRTGLGVAGLFLVAASGFAAYGICSAFAVPFTALSELLPFILVGVGVDDMFIMIASFDHTNPSLPIEERIALGLKRCGISITYTCLTKFCAFMLGSLTTLPALEYFCTYAATAILFNFVLQVTAFSAFLTLDAKRQASGRMDWCCCFADKKYLEERIERSVSTAAVAPLDSPERKGNGTPQKAPVYMIHTSAKIENGAEGKADPLSNHRGASLANGKFSPRVLKGERDEKSTMMSSDRTVASMRHTYSRKNSSREQIGEHVNPMAQQKSDGAEEAEERPEMEEANVFTNGKGLRKKRGFYELNALGRWMRDKYAPSILSGKGKAIVLLSAAGLFAAGIYGATKTTQGFEEIDLAPDDHFARDYSDLAYKYEIEYTSQFLPLSIYVSDVDYTDASVQATIEEADTVMTSEEFIAGPVDSWLTAFTEWASISDVYGNKSGEMGGYRVYEDNSTFYEALWAFFNTTSNERFLANVVFDDDGVIKMSKSDMFLVNLSSTADSVDSMRSARRVMGNTSLDPKPFSYSPAFVFFEQYLVIYDELTTNFFLALAAVGVLSLVAMGRVSIVIIVCLTVMIIDVELLGFVYHWGLEMNGITVIELVMAVGLVVDYMAHILHYFLHQNPGESKDARIANALAEIGPSVVISAATTFVGILPMAFADIAVFRVFFKIFFVIIFFGFFHGIAFIPVTLSLLPECIWERSNTKAVETLSVMFDDNPDDLDTGDNDWFIYEGHSTMRSDHMVVDPAVAAHSCSIVPYENNNTTSNTAAVQTEDAPEASLSRSISAMTQDGDGQGDEKFIDGDLAVVPRDGMSELSDSASSLRGGSYLTGSSSIRDSSFPGSSPILHDRFFLGGGSLLGFNPLLGRVFRLPVGGTSRDIAAMAGRNETFIHSEEKIPDALIPELYHFDSKDDEAKRVASWQETSRRADEPRSFVMPRPRPRSLGMAAADALTDMTPKMWTSPSRRKESESRRGLKMWKSSPGDLGDGEPSSIRAAVASAMQADPSLSVSASSNKGNKDRQMHRSASWQEAPLAVNEPYPFVMPRPRPRSSGMVATDVLTTTGPSIWPSPNARKESESRRGLKMWKSSPGDLGEGEAISIRAAVASAMQADPSLSVSASSNKGNKDRQMHRSASWQGVPQDVHESYPSVGPKSRTHSLGMATGTPVITGPKMWISPSRRKEESESRRGPKMWQSSVDFGEGRVSSVQTAAASVEPQAEEPSGPRMWKSSGVEGDGSAAVEMLSAQAPEGFAEPQVGEASGPRMWKSSPGVERDSSVSVEMLSAQAPTAFAEPQVGKASGPKMWNSSPGVVPRVSTSVERPSAQAPAAFAEPQVGKASGPRMWKSSGVEEDMSPSVEMLSAQAPAGFAEPQVGQASGPRMWKSSPGAVPSVSAAVEIFSNIASGAPVEPQAGVESGPKMWKSSDVVPNGTVANKAAAFEAKIWKKETNEA